MKSATKTNSDVKTERKNQEFGDKNEAIILWKHQSEKSGNTYLTGYTGKAVKDKIKLVGFFNTNKKNPKQPDVSIYEQMEDGTHSKDPIATLWSNVGKSGKTYLSGKTNDDEKLTGFYGSEQERRPYIRAYFTE